ncbi:MAG: PH domain-containing protein [Lachnospiraceae bacterium]|nr:PH domain-containing protein [Lachnospiraceae bacterium]
MSSGKVIFANIIGLLLKVGFCVFLFLTLDDHVWIKVVAIILCVLLLVKDVYISALINSETISANSKYKWHDRKRIALFGLPWTFTKYCLTNEKLVMIKGLFNTREDEVKLYRVTDFALTRKFWQKLFGLGTLEVKSSDKTCPSLPLINIKKSNAVKELISKLVEDERDRKRVTGREIINNHDHDCDGMDDYDGDNDIDNSGEIF